jgi:hypothetical protein
LSKLFFSYFDFYVPLLAKNLYLLFTYYTSIDINVTMAAPNIKYLLAMDSEYLVDDVATRRMVFGEVAKYAAPMLREQDQYMSRLFQGMSAANSDQDRYSATNVDEVTSRIMDLSLRGDNANKRARAYGILETFIDI